MLIDKKNKLIILHIKPKRYELSCVIMTPNSFLEKKKRDIQIYTRKLTLIIFYNLSSFKELFKQLNSILLMTLLKTMDNILWSFFLGNTFQWVFLCSPLTSISLSQPFSENRFVPHPHLHQSLPSVFFYKFSMACQMERFYGWNVLSDAWSFYESKVWFEFRVFLLLDRLPKKARLFSLPLYLIISEKKRDEIMSILIIISVNWNANSFVQNLNSPYWIHSQQQ